FNEGGSEVGLASPSSCKTSQGAPKLYAKDAEEFRADTTAFKPLSASFFGDPIILPVRRSDAIWWYEGGSLSKGPPEYK
ncbi:MAG: hypothetical protein ABIA74_05025, partial [bacterium]